jgi:hypothetical protein
MVAVMPATSWGAVMTMVMPVSWVLENETVYAYTRSP